MYRLCGDTKEVANRIISKQQKQQNNKSNNGLKRILRPFVAFAYYTKQKTKHDVLKKVIHWELCKRFKFNPADKWHIHKREPVLKRK